MTGGEPVAARRAYAERPAESREGAEILSSKANTQTLRRLALTAILAMLAGALVLVGPAAALTDSRTSTSGALAAAAADPVQINFTLEGCRNTGSIVLPDGSGNFICPDAAYTTGNLGKGWNELDLVPHRVTLKDNGANQTYSFIVAGDYKNGSGTGTGWDVISALVLNTVKSDASCSAATTGAQTITPSGSGVGGADQTIYRLVTVTQTSGQTCVYDYYQRLALGAHNFSGSSLQSNLWNQSLSSSGIGQKRLSLPVGEILPQSITKDMSASQGSAHTWSVLKSAPASLAFGDTCDPANRSKPVSITVSWTKSAPAPNGDVTITTNITATNPASRVITVNVSDVMYEGLTQTTQVTPTSGTNPASSGDVDVPANTTQLVFTHTITTASSATSFNDVATATYTDKITGVPVPGNAQATASATVQSSGTTTNDTATIQDVESISGANLSYSADSFSGASGSFAGGYVAGTPTAGSVTWDSATQSGDNSVTFSKTVYVSQASNTSGTLSDTATLNGSDGFTTSGNASVALQPSALVKLTINKSIPNVLSGSETETFNFSVKDSSNTVVATPSISFSAGETSKSVDVTGLAPDTYTVSETGSASGKWALQGDQSKSISLPSCSGSVSFSNNFNLASAQARKITDPTGFESGWDLYLNGPGIAAPGEKVTTTGTSYVGFSTVLQEGTYTITETPKSGWTQTGSTGCTFTVNYPADAGQIFSCSITNRSRATARVVKTVNGGAPTGGQSFTFELRSGASVGSAGTILETANATAANGGVINFSTQLLPGTTYALCELVMPGWMTTLGPPFYVVYNPSGDNSVVCTDFTPAVGDSPKVFSIDNKPPPGGLARTIGFWKNWASCAGSNGKQKPVLDQTLALALSTNSPLYWGRTKAGATLYLKNLTCAQAVSLLNKSPFSAKKASSDPAFNLAAQLIAAELNVVAGAGTCPAALQAINDASALLYAIHFDGSTHDNMTAAQTTQANSLATTLDKYNNNQLC
jgi:hypothetical protein